MNIKPSFFMPKNDEELNAYIASINSAYGQGLDFHVGPKRSEKLRDVICNHLGFPNGYQQLQGYWNNIGHYDVMENPQERALLVYADVLGELPAAMLFNEITPWIIDRLRFHFPCTSAGFLKGDELSSGGRQGWALSAPSESFLEMTEWVPLYIGSLQVGYANAYRSRHMAMLMQALLTSLYLSEGKILKEKMLSSLNEEWVSAVKFHDLADKPALGKVVSLRMESMKESLLIPIEGEVTITADEFKFSTSYAQSKGGAVIKSCYLDAVKDSPHGDAFLDGVHFDFVSVYDFSSDDEDTLSVLHLERNGKTQPPKEVDKRNVAMLEWFPKDRVEVREGDDFLDADLKEATEIRILK